LHRWAEHTGELELELEAESEAALFESAVEAMAELLGEGGGEGAAIARDVSLAAGDRAALLADWIGEIAYLAERDGLVPERLERLELRDSGLEARISGRAGSPPHLVKGATYHRLELRQDPDAWRARVVLDV